MRKQQGFTMLELVVVITIVGILGVMLMTQAPDRGLHLHAQANQLANDIRYTQNLAQSRGQRYRINFFADRYTITDQSGGTPVLHPATQSNAYFLDPQINLSNTNAFIVFDGKGVPYTDAATPGTALSANSVLTLSAGGDTQQVTITPETGRVVQP